MLAPTRAVKESTDADKGVDPGAAEVEAETKAPRDDRADALESSSERTSRASESNVVASPNEGGDEDGDDGIADDSDGDDSVDDSEAGDSEAEAEADAETRRSEKKAEKKGRRGGFFGFGRDRGGNAKEKKKLGKRKSKKAAAKAAAEALEAEKKAAEKEAKDAETIEAERELEEGLAREESGARDFGNPDAAGSGNQTTRTGPPQKGVDLLTPVDYLSPALAQKMARNGHLSALNNPQALDPSGGALPTPQMAALRDAESRGASAAGKKNLEGVLYTSDALAEASDASKKPLVVEHDFAYCESPTPVFVMLPLDVISRDGELQHARSLDVSLRTLKKIGAEGVMIDVWWGIVERDGPELYDWSAYLELLHLVRDAGLKLNAVMSFHACGANVGDYFRVTLPQWVLDSAATDPDLFFTDQYGYRNPECISLWADNAMTLQGRTPLECYRDFMRSFKEAVAAEGLRETVSEVSVGCGPCGELRYPAYPENKRSPNSSQWQFPGIGEFQCYDQRALGNLARAGSEAGHIEWGGAGPHDAGGYNNLPHETGFFRAHLGSWDSEYGQFFLSWYAGELVEHGDRMLKAARSVFDADADAKDPTLAIKCAGVHWWYNSRSHAAELTAGYFNTRSGDTCPERDGYEPIVKICRKHGARLNFTCAEMRDIEHPFFSRCGPEGLLRQIRAAAARYGVKVAGENALCRFDQDAYDKIITNCRGEGDDAKQWASGAMLPPMASFTFLRLSKELFEDDNFHSFVHFVARMANETGTKGREELVRPDEVLAKLFSDQEMLPSGLSDIRDETSSGFVAAQFSDL